MKLKNVLIILLSNLLPFIAISQSGPSGVGDTLGNSSLQLWLKATDLDESHLDGDKVLLWSDRSGATNHVSTTAATAPFYKKGTASPASIEFRGSQFLQTLGTSNSFNNPAATIFLVKKGANRGTPIALAERGWVNEMLLLGDAQFHHSSSGNFVKQSHPCISQIPSEEVSIVTGVFGQEPTDLRFLVNGVEAPTSLQQSRSNVRDFEEVDRKVTIGQRDQFVSSEYFVGELLEVIVYNRQLDDEELQQVEAYLQCTYQIEPTVCAELAEVNCELEPMPDTCPLLTESFDAAPLQLWLKASDLEKSIADGDKVMEWQDRSGAANHLLGSSPGAPVFKKGALDMPSAVAFNGAQFLQTIDVSSSFNNPAATIFLVKQGAYNGAAIAIAEQGWVNEMLLFDKEQYHHSSSGNFTRLSHPCIEHIPDEEPTIICGVFGPVNTDLRYFVNGEEAPKSNIRTAGTPRNFEAVDRKVTIGQRDQFVASEYFEGDILEVLVFNRQLNDEEIIHVQNYLQCTYPIEQSICAELNEPIDTTENIPTDSISTAPNCENHQGRITLQACAGEDLRYLINSNDCQLLIPSFEVFPNYVPRDYQPIKFDYEVDSSGISCFFEALPVRITCIENVDSNCYEFYYVGRILEEECGWNFIQVIQANKDTLLIDAYYPEEEEPSVGSLIQFNFQPETVGRTYAPQCFGRPVVADRGKVNCISIIEEGIPADTIPDCICPQVVAPVCGTDGNVYNNSCEAACAGVGVVHNGPSCDFNDLCVITIKNGFCTPIDIFDEHDNLLTTMQAGPTHGFDGFTFWEDLNFLLRGTTRTYTFKKNGVIIERQTASCEDNIITLVSDQMDPCAEVMDSMDNTEVIDSIDNTEVMDSMENTEVVDSMDHTAMEDSADSTNALFIEYPWLLDKFNPTTCRGESIKVYQSGIYFYLLVRDADGVAILYNQDGLKYCQNSNNYDCVAAYNFGPAIAIWDCPESEGCICPQVVDPVCGSDFKTYNNTCEATCAGREVLYEGLCNMDSSTDDIYSDYPWLLTLTDPDSCSIVQIDFYQSGIYEYLLLTFATDVTILYNDQGQFYCQHTATYNCIAAYNFGAPFATWICNGGTTSDSEMMEATPPISEILEDIEIREVQCVVDGIIIIKLSVKSFAAGETPRYHFYSEEGNPYFLDLQLSPYEGATLAYPTHLADEIVILVEEVSNPDNQSRIVIPVSACEGFATGEENVERSAQTSPLDFSAYPNPVLDKLSIQLPTPTTSTYQLYIHDLFGQIMHKQTVTPLTTSIDINMSDLAHGIYYIELRAAGKRRILKVVKQGLE